MPGWYSLFQLKGVDSFAPEVPPNPAVGVVTGLSLVLPWTCRRTIWRPAPQGYGSRAIRQFIADDGALAVIPSKKNARESISHDAGLYNMRNIVERFFCTMQDMRRLATRFEKLSSTFLAMIHISAMRLWIN